MTSREMGEPPRRLDRNFSGSELAMSAGSSGGESVSETLGERVAANALLIAAVLANFVTEVDNWAAAGLELNAPQAKTNNTQKANELPTHLWRSLVIGLGIKEHL
jgi:hypothetical protein